jgi:hypothetical protein
VPTAIPSVRSRRSITASLIAGLQPNGRKRDIADPAVRGLVLRIGPSGNKYWLFRFKWKRSKPRIALGAFPDVSFAEARELASANRRFLERGIDPRRAARPDQLNRRDENAKLP